MYFENLAKSNNKRQNADYPKTNFSIKKSFSCVNWYYGPIQRWGIDWQTYQYFKKSWKLDIATYLKRYVVVCYNMVQVYTIWCTSRFQFYGEMRALLNVGANHGTLFWSGWVPPVSRSWPMDSLVPALDTPWYEIPFSLSVLFQQPGININLNPVLDYPKILTWPLFFRYHNMIVQICECLPKINTCWFF